MNRTMRAESGTKVAKEDVWDQVPALVGRFGHAAEQYAARFDFGISPEVIRGRMEPILGDARRIRLAGWGALPGGPVLQECLARLRDLAPKTYQKTVARIAGVFVIHSYFRSRMTHEAIGQAISTSSFYELTQDLLDDLLDGGGWTVREAVRLYDRCLPALARPARNLRVMALKHRPVRRTVYIGRGAAARTGRPCPRLALLQRGCHVPGTLRGSRGRPSRGSVQHRMPLRKPLGHDPWRELVRRIHVSATSIDLRESDRVPRPRCARRSRGWWTSRGIRALGRDDPDDHLRHVQDAAGPGGLVLCDPRPRTPGHDGDRACHIGGCHPRVNGTTKCR